MRSARWSVVALVAAAGVLAAFSGGAFWPMFAAACLAITAGAVLEPLPSAAAGALAGLIAAFPVVRGAYAFAPLSFREWASVALFVAIWAVGAASIAWVRRRSRWVTLPLALVAALFITGSTKSLEHKLDPVVWRAFYLTMPDGVKVATDLYLPRSLKTGERLPTVFRQLRYYRSIAFRWPVNIWLDDRPAIIERLVAGNHYAAVVTDVRGSGASFGWRAQEWSPQEVRDGSRLVDWIVAQPWSNGRVGAVGGSYDGAAAEFLLTNGNPAVKAAILMFCLYDPYTDVGFPGGINLRWFTDSWSRSLGVLDSNRLMYYVDGWLAPLAFIGVKPVDGDWNQSQLRAAVAEHKKNYDGSAFARNVTFRDDLDPAGMSMDAMSPARLLAWKRHARVPVYNVSGWLDGGYQGAAVKRFLNLGAPGSRLLIGPWDHGARNQIDPYLHAPPLDLAAELIPFFDKYLKDKPTAIDAQPPVRYYTMAEGRWHYAHTWPPPQARSTTYFFETPHALGTRDPDAAGGDAYRVDLDATPGIYARWNSLSSAGTGRTGYFERNAQDKKLLIYQTAPLASDVTVTGNPVVTLYVKSTARDGEFFAYLEDVDEHGHVYYATEGQLRAVDRRIATSPLYRDVVPQHSFRSADAAPLVPGQVTQITFGLLPISWLFKQGHSIRVALAGADRGHFVLPEQASTWSVLRGGAHASRITLPVMPRTGSE
ncbi:MAG: CocE/NonD family hydrolase [Vulcanimicrobiaceae bacterium]